MNFVADQLLLVFQRLADIADGLRRRLGHLLVLAAAAAVYLAYVLFSSDSALWWNAIKCGVVFVPVLICIVVWLVLNQLAESPETAKTLIDDKNQLLQHLSQANAHRVSGVRGAYSTLRALREQEGLEGVMDTISGVGLLINPLFAICALLAFFTLFGLILAAFVVLLF